MKKIFITGVLIFTGYISFSQQATPAPVYPKIVGYVSFLHPIITFDKNGNTVNFSDYYTVAFPIGINIIKSAKIGFSFEVAPFIRSQNDTVKVSSILFHPGIIYKFNPALSFATRIAFETNGRFGFTPILNKVVIKEKNVSYFTAVSTPVRMGNAKPASIGLAVQLGMNF
ncbi:MAG TPA: hypothetical protein PLA68_12560 [Panacibacter sp.]|nr:hypothetical protein [Panacibacter sp.]